MIRGRLHLRFAMVLQAAALASTLAAARVGANGERALREAITDLQSHAAEIDEVTALINAGPEGRSSALVRLRESSRDGSAAHAVTCLESGGCDPAVPLAAEKQRLRGRAEAASNEVAASRRLTLALEAAAVVAFFVSAVLLWLPNGRRGVPLSAPALSAPAPSAPANEDMSGYLRARLEELYTARRRAWESDRFAAYGEIAAGLSHGLKTPLAGIRAATQAAQAKLAAGHPAAGNLEDVLGEVDTLLEQVRRFLHASGTGAPVPARVRPDTLVDALISEYREGASRNGVSLGFISQEVPELLVDPALLEIALRNVVENALSVSPTGSAIEIVVRPSSPPPRAGLDDAPPPPERSWVEIAIRDHGPGLNSAPLLGRSSKPDGSGLGIAIARRIVGRHGGSLRYESPADGGTNVSVLLPVPGAEG